MFHWVLLPKDWVSSFALHGNRTTKHRVLSVAPKLCWCRPHRRPSSLAWTVWDCLNWISSLVEICWWKSPRNSGESRQSRQRGLGQGQIRQWLGPTPFPPLLLFGFQRSGGWIVSLIISNVNVICQARCKTHHDFDRMLSISHSVASPCLFDKKSSGFISSIPHPQWIDGQLPVDFARMCTMRQMRDVTFYSMQVMPMATRTIDH